MEELASSRVNIILQATYPVMEYITSSRWSERRHEPGICDFLLGNPHDMPLPEFSEAMRKWSTPQDKDWFAYKMSEPASREVIASALRQSHSLPFEPEDIQLTNGAFAGLTVALTTLTDPGDEVIYISPPWFFYEALILANYAKPVRVPCDQSSYDLDLKAISDAIHAKTRAIIINSPNNPTGKIYPESTLRELANILDRASEKFGRRIYIISDESYNKIVYDGEKYISPTAFYPHTFLVYTYGKTLLTPGQRIGYIALPPAMPKKEMMRYAVFIAQTVSGYAFPNALLQHALPDLQMLSIDVDRLQAKRDKMYRRLKDMGYELNCPQGTFYILAHSPDPKDLDFTDRLAEQDVYCLPGSLFEMPGYFRISLTANEEMIERALPVFRWAIGENRSQKSEDISQIK